MIFDPTTILQNLNIPLFIKIAALILIGLYAIFSFMLATKIRSFNKILFLPPNSGGGLMQFIALMYTVTILVLFVLTLLLI